MIDNKNKVLFIHVPRTGGSVLEREYWGKYLSNDMTSQEFWTKCHPVRTALVIDGKHVTYKQYMESGLIKNIKDWKIFTIARNTFDLVWSNWYLVNGYKEQKNIPLISWKQYIHLLQTDPLERNRVNQSRYIEGSNNVDVIMYENLTQDVKRIVNLDIPCKFNARGYENRVSHYSEVYDERDIGVIKELYTEDIKRYNFTYDDR